MRSAIALNAMHYGDVKTEGREKRFKKRFRKNSVRKLVAKCAANIALEQTQ
ncbi:hypothetical protein [Chryseosolibacter indicus]|uniref:Uncharacterized protein n=1 Tax=Chryseosolibacter indicus TaxID=2782351 RepID=A0ABS5VN92_9BACT|nr:hypothetical protein [Chryseosolibacter indicus]MBT1702898.1 hypothetical protein [Chryseosolibacter indicus]